jgi:hypothetical protein
MRKIVACLFLTLSVIAIVSCGKKEEARPTNEPKTEETRQTSTGGAEFERQAKEAAPAPEVMSEQSADLAKAEAPGQPNSATPTKPQVGLVEGLTGFLRADTSAPSDKKFIRTGDIKFRVENVHKATEMIEDLTAKYKGFVVSSDLQNNEDRTSENRYTKDSVVLIKQITVKGEIKLRVPAEKLDSLVRELNNVLVFLDYRILRRDDVTLRFASIKKQKDRLLNYERRQRRNIDTKSSNLEAKTYAEENLLDKQMQIDDKDLQNMDLEDQVKYATITLWIYQPPLVISEKIYNFDYIDDLRPSFWERSWESVVKGWYGIEIVLIGLITIWPIFILLALGYYIFRYVRNLRKK